mgnify:CR=1 FL=1
MNGGGNSRGKWGSKTSVAWQKYVKANSSGKNDILYANTVLAKKGKVGNAEMDLILTSIEDGDFNKERRDYYGWSRIQKMLDPVWRDENKLTNDFKGMLAWLIEVDRYASEGEKKDTEDFDYGESEQEQEDFDYGESDQVIDAIENVSEQSPFANYMDEPTSEGSVNILNMSHSDLKDLGFWRDIKHGGGEEIHYMDIDEFIKAEIKVAESKGTVGRGGMFDVNMPTGSDVVKAANTAIIKTGTPDQQLLSKLFGRNNPITIGAVSGQYKAFKPAGPAEIDIEFPDGGYYLVINGKSITASRIKIRSLSWTGSKKQRMVVPTVDLKYFKLEESYRFAKNRFENVIKESLSRGSLYRRRYGRY